jgi:uncharacterized BrkB/YihY/UPF0761 family membrane protein
LNTAQKVRLWFTLAALVIILLGQVVIGAANGVGADLGTVLLTQSTWQGIQGWDLLGLISAVSLAVLGPITLYRFLHPEPPKAVAASVPAHGYCPPQPPAQPSSYNPYGGQH